MEEQKDMLGLLDMMVQPVFCVKENIIIRVNAAAQQLFLSVGDDVRPLLENGAEDSQALLEYIVGPLGGVIGEAYAQPYGQGRMVSVR